MVGERRSQFPVYTFMKRYEKLIPVDSQEKKKGFMKIHNETQDLLTFQLSSGVPQPLQTCRTSRYPHPAARKPGLRRISQGPPAVPAGELETRAECPSLRSRLWSPDNAASCYHHPGMHATHTGASTEKKGLLTQRTAH